MDITGKVFDIVVINEKVAQVVIKKRVRNKTVPIAFNVFGYWRDLVVKDLKLKKNDKIFANFYMESKLFKGKYYTEVSMRNIELLPEKPKEGVTIAKGQYSLIPDSEVKDENGNLIL